MASLWAFERRGLHRSKRQKTSRQSSRNRHSSIGHHRRCRSISGQYCRPSCSCRFDRACTNKSNERAFGWSIVSRGQYRDRIARVVPRRNLSRFPATISAKTRIHGAQRSMAHLRLRSLHETNIRQSHKATLLTNAHRSESRTTRRAAGSRPTCWTATRSWIRQVRSFSPSGPPPRRRLLSLTTCLPPACARGPIGQCPIQAVPALSQAARDGRPPSPGGPSGRELPGPFHGRDVHDIAHRAGQPDLQHGGTGQPGQRHHRVAVGPPPQRAAVTLRFVPSP